MLLDRHPGPRVSAVSLTLVLAITLVPCGASSQESGVEKKLSQIDASLKEIVRVLSRLDQRQEADLILRRMDLESRKVETLESTLRNRRNEQDGLSQEVERFQAEMERIREQIFALDSLGSPEAAEEMAQQQDTLDQYEMMLEMTTERLWSLDQQIQELENELSGPRAQLRALEAAFDERVLP